MTSQGNQVPLAPGPRGPGPYSRASTPHRPECYHSTAATGASYMSNTPGATQAALRVQPTQQQQTATPTPQKDLVKTTMAGHSYVTPQNQTAPTRPQYQNYQYRPAQHGTRPNSHPRQQQPFIPGAPTTPSGPVMYPAHVLYPPQMFNQQSYQQPRSQGYPVYITPYYSSAPGHNTSYYYQPNNQPLSTNLQANTTSSRNSQTPLTGPQGTTPTPTNTATTLSHPQAQTHIHQPLAGIRQAPLKRSHRVRIINPDTQKEISLDDSQSLSGESSERQTPQPEPPTHNIAEEFNRMVNEAAQQPTASEIKSSYVSKNTDISSTSIVQPQTNAISNISNIVKSDLLNVNEIKIIGPDIALESNETPVVSAMSDSPVIVPKIPKQFQKPCEQPLVIDTSKNMQPKQFKKSKPVVPQVDDVEKSTDFDSPVVPPVASLVTTSVSSNEVWIAPENISPLVAPMVASVPLTTSIASTASQPTTVFVAEPRQGMPLAPQPQKTREPRIRHKSEDKPTLDIKGNDADILDNEKQPLSLKPNGPTVPVVISSVDSLPEVISSSTSQNSQQIEALIKPDEKIDITVESTKPAAVPTPTPTPTPTELLSASIDKLANLELSTSVEILPESKEASSAIQAQAKLTQSIASCLRTNQPQTKMKDINLNNKTIDPDTANGNSEVEISETAEEDINKNEKVVNNTTISKNTNQKNLNKMASIESSTKDSESYEICKNENETDKISVEQETSVEKEEILDKENNDDNTEVTPPVFVPKYKYSDDQWSPLNKSGKKYYDIGLLKQIKDDPMSKNKPNVPLLETWNIFRTAPLQEPLSFAPMSRSVNDTIMPSFLKNAGVNSRNNPSRDIKKDARNMTLGKGSIKSPQTPSASSRDKPIIHVSLSLRDDVKLNQAENAWKPSWATKKESADEAEFKTQELYKKFRGILNKLTPQKFETLMERVKTLDINNRKRLEGVIDLVFEKAIEEPNFSEAYAAMCNKLSMLKVPADNATAPDQYVNFRALIISKCQNQFQTNKVDEQVSKLEKEMIECTDPAKKKELQLQLTEEIRKVRMRSVGNVRFIGELYKLKMLTPKIMGYCMTYLVDKLEEEKLECLCKLLTTIGQQVENELKTQLDDVFRKMRDIVDHKSNKISSRVRFMIQDVIALRKRRWTLKSVVDSQPKTMDQIQKEAEEHQRHIEIVNASPMPGFRRDEGNRGKRGDNRRQSSNTYMDSNQWKTPRYPLDMSKLKAVSQNAKNVSNTKLAPQNSWNFGPSAKNVQASSNSMINVSKNKFSALETVSTEPPLLRGNKDISPCPKGASIERSSFSQRTQFSGGSGSRSGSTSMTRSNSGNGGADATIGSPAQVETPAAPPPQIEQEPFPETKRNFCKSMIELCLISPNDEELVSEIKLKFEPQHHAALITEILNIALLKSAKDIQMVIKSLLYILSTKTISIENFVRGLKEIFDIAPDLYIDVPMLYEYLGKLIALHIEKKYVTFKQTLDLCEGIISANQGNLFLKAVIKELQSSMGPSFVKNKWQESGLKLTDFMHEDQVSKWLEENKFEFLEGGANPPEVSEKILTPLETHSKLLQLLNAGESWDCIKGWIQDNLGKSANEDWFMRTLIQAICENATAGNANFSQEKMGKYVSLINEFGESTEVREASCLIGIQQLIHRLEHPKGLTLEIFQYLHEQYIISVEGFLAWEISEKELEGKAVMKMALTSFFTSIKEADNDDSCSED